MKIIREKNWSLAFFLFGMVVAVPSLVSAAEPVKEFLDALREKRYFEEALDYLDQMEKGTLIAYPEKSKDVPKDVLLFKESIPYERAVTRIGLAKFKRDFRLREEQLDLAQAAIKDFVEKQPGHRLAFTAKNQLGNVTVEHARIRSERSKKPNEAGRKTELLKEARELYGEAYKIFHGLDEDIKQRLETIPKDVNEKKDPKLFVMREQLRGDYLEAQLLSAKVLEETSEVVDKGTKDYKDLLTNSAKEYGQIYEKYKTRLAGLYARMYQGQCEQKLDNMKESLVHLEAILGQPDEPAEFHALKTKALLLAMDCWAHDSQKKFEVIIDQGTKWIEKAYPSEVKSDEFMELRIKVARAIKAQVAVLKAKDAKGPAINVYQKDGRKLLQYVVKTQNPFQKDAQKLLPDFGVDTDKSADKRKVFKTFADAIDAGKESMDDYKIANLSVQSFPARIREEKDPAAKKELDDQFKLEKEKVSRSISDAGFNFQRALTLVNKETSKDDLETVYYYLSFIKFYTENYQEAAVIGEFLARRAPDSNTAKQCAKIAMVSELKIFNETKTKAREDFDAILAKVDSDKDEKLTPEEIAQLAEPLKSELKAFDLDNSGKIDLAEYSRYATRFESEQIMSIAQYLIEKWPGTMESEEALSTLISFMITEGQIAKAEEYLKGISPDSPQRGVAELRIGQALWAHYLRGMQSVREIEEKAKQPGAEKVQGAADLPKRRNELQETKTRAEKTLVDGVARMEKSGKVDGTLVAAALSLSQVYVDTNQALKAVALMNNEKFGPLVLVKKKDETTEKKGFAEETYKTALRANISSLSMNKDPKESEEAMKKAKEVMESLKGAIGGTDEGKKQLIAIYVSLAKDLEQQMNLASSEDRKALSVGFQQFLGQISQGTKELDVLFWIASTYKGIGGGLGDPKSAEAARFFDEAIKTYQSIIDRSQKKAGEADKIDLEPNMRSQILLEMARIRVATGEFEKAIEAFNKLLLETNVLLNAQIEAATALQKWGEASKKPEHYKAAMSGTSVKGTGKKAIWGWGETARKTAGNAKFHNAFYESRLNLSRCAIGIAKLPATTEAEKLAQYKRAKDFLVQTIQLYPKIEAEAGTDSKNFYADYDSVLKEIQDALKEPKTGIKEILDKIKQQEAANKPANNVAKGDPAGNGPPANAPATPAPANENK